MVHGSIKPPYEIVATDLRPLSCDPMLMFMSPPSGKHLITIVCMVDLQRESQCSLHLVAFIQSNLPNE